MRIAVVLTLLVTASPVQAQPTGGLAGCITARAQQVLQDATVTMSAAGEKHRTVTDTRGCYEFKALPPNLYRITVRHPRFNNVTRDKISIGPGQTVRLDFSMDSIIALCDCEPPGRTLQQMTDRVQAIVYLRITQHDGELPVRRTYFRQTADVLKVLKYHRHMTDGSTLGPATQALHELLRRDPSLGAIRTSITFLQDQSWGAPEPYDPGEELVMFLYWSPGERTFEARTRHSEDRSDRDTVL